MDVYECVCVSVCVCECECERVCECEHECVYRGGGVIGWRYGV